MTLIERMRQAGLATDVRALFAAPTLAGLAALADTAATPSSWSSRPTAFRPAARPSPRTCCLWSVWSRTRSTASSAAVPGGAANVQDIYPLAPLQEGILFHHLMESEGDAYLMPVLMAFDTRERLDSFLTALQAVVDTPRHPAHCRSLGGVAGAGAGGVAPGAAGVEEVVLDPEAGEAAEQLAERLQSETLSPRCEQAPLISGFTAYDAKKKRWLLRCWLTI